MGVSVSFEDFATLLLEEDNPTQERVQKLANLLENITDQQFADFMDLCGSDIKVDEVCKHLGLKNPFED